MLGNCIGFHNLKYFLLLHLYTLLGGSNLIFWFMMGVKRWGFGSNHKPTFWVEYVLPLIFCTMITMGSIGQLVMNLYMNVKNRTQLEVMEDFNHSIFDTGSIIENLKQNFGDPKCKLLWLLPIDTNDKP